MRFISTIILLGFFFSSCSNADKKPDISGIKIELQTMRFEQELFKIDSVNFAAQFDQLQARYPAFGENYAYTVLGADPQWSSDSVAAYVQTFTHFFKSIFDTSQIVFKNFAPYESEIKQSFQYLKYYFPDYNTPKNIITFIGPLDGIGMAAGDGFIAVGLQLHLGANFTMYKTALVGETYPDYVSARFAPEYISIDCMNLVLNDLYPEKLEDKALVLQMVEKGKRLYLLSKLLPQKEEYQLIGYTKPQLKAVYEHEVAVWDLFVQNNFLRILDNNIIKNYIGESPKTQELGEGAPGNIGSFVGWQIVKKYMQKNSGTTLQQLMALDNETIFQQAKYKP